MKKFWIGLAMGVLVGGAAVLVWAPQSGASTRRKLRHGLEDLGDNLNEIAEYVKDQTERFTAEAQAFVGLKTKKLQLVAKRVPSFLESESKAA